MRDEGDSWFPPSGPSFATIACYLRYLSMTWRARRLARPASLVIAFGPSENLGLASAWVALAEFACAAGGCENVPCRIQRMIFLTFQATSIRNALDQSLNQFETPMHLEPARDTTFDRARRFDLRFQAIVISRDLGRRREGEPGSGNLTHRV
jgi:hypothetical protein